MCFLKRVQSKKIKLEKEEKSFYKKYPQLKKMIKKKFFF